MQIETAGPTLNSLRIAVIGDPSVGKKTYLQKLGRKQNQDLLSKLQNEEEGFLINIHLQSNCGPCQVSLIHIKQTNLNFDEDNFAITESDKMIKNCDGCIIMFCLLARQTYKNVPNYYRKWVSLAQNNNVVLVSTKLDDGKNIKIKQKQILFHRKKNIGFYNVSSKAGYNILKPIQFLFRKKLGNNKLEFVNVENLIDLEGEVAIQNLQIIQKEIQELSTFCFPEDDDD